MNTEFDLVWINTGGACYKVMTSRKRVYTFRTVSYKIIRILESNIRCRNALLIQYTVLQNTEMSEPIPLRA